jgi:hypothetical protein
MNSRILNPLNIPNWDDLLLSTVNASFFHSSAWARVLVESYGYKPLYFTSLENGSLSSLVPFMEINSSLSGKRGVSLPFTDECSQIVPDSGFFQELVKDVIDYGEKAGWKYIEWRNGEYFPEEVITSDFYFTHEVDLTKTEEDLFSNLRDSTRRNVKKAYRGGVLVEISRFRDSIESFYRLNCMTRQRHGLPPQPFSFFTRIFEHIISQGQGTIVSALYSGKTIASAVFFNFGRKVIYKYGASDLVHQDLRPNNLIMWEAIKWHRERGFELLNLGRTELENKGLLQFKRGWGAEERLLKYYRYDFKKEAFLGSHRKACGSYNRIFACAPIPMLRILGSLLYKHAG